MPRSRGRPSAFVLRSPVPRSLFRRHVAGELPMPPGLVPRPRQGSTFTLLPETSVRPSVEGALLRGGKDRVSGESAGMQ